MYLGAALSLNGKYVPAEKILNRVLQLSPYDMLPLLYLIENSIRAEDLPRAREYARILFEYFETPAIRNQLENFSKDHKSAPLSPKLISSVLDIQLEQ
jgi:hypothetical protein